MKTIESIVIIIIDWNCSQGIFFLGETMYIFKQHSSDNNKQNEQDNRIGKRNYHSCSHFIICCNKFNKIRARTNERNKNETGQNE